MERVSQLLNNYIKQSLLERGPASRPFTLEINIRIIYGFFGKGKEVLILDAF